MENKKIKYRTGGWHDLIEEVEIIRETESSVWIKERGKEVRHAKHSQFANFFDTQEEAVEHLKIKYKKAMELHQQRLDKAKERLTYLILNYGEENDSID